MKVIGKVQGSLEQAQPLVVNIDTVYVHTNIKKVEGEDQFGNPIENLYEYDETQYTLSEYIQMLGTITALSD